MCCDWLGLARHNHHNERNEQADDSSGVYSVLLPVLGTHLD